MSSFIQPVVRVGVGAIVSSCKYPNKILVGVRKGSHGAGRLALPGGHLEIGESWKYCCEREVKEETNLDVISSGLNFVTNDTCIDGNPEKHYITIFMNASIKPESSDLVNLEPNKCEGWEWMDVEELKLVHVNNPDHLFDPLKRYISEGGRFLN